MKSTYKTKVLMSVIMILTLVLTATAASAAINSVTVGPQSGTLTYGTGSSVTYPITVDKSGAMTIVLSITGLPAGATGSFSPNNIQVFGGASNIPSTLTITALGTTAAGSTSFTVQAKGGLDTKTTSGTLVIVTPPTPPVPELSISILTATGLIGLFGLVRFSKRK